MRCVVVEWGEENGKVSFASVTQKKREEREEYVQKHALSA